MNSADWRVYWIDEFGDRTRLEKCIYLRAQLEKDGERTKLEIELDNYSEDYINEEGQTIFQSGEILEFYADENEVDLDNNDHLIGIFRIKNITFKTQGHIIKVEAVDNTYEMLANVYINNIEAPVNDIVKNVVTTINIDGITKDTIEYDIASTRDDGSAFPTRKFASASKTGYEVVMELSQPEMTGDVAPYTFRFTNNNVFEWHLPPLEADDVTLEYGRWPVIRIDADKTESESISMIIYNAGDDKNGRGIVFYQVNPEATSLNNIEQPMSMTDIARDLKEQLKVEGEYDDMSNSDFRELCKERANARCRRIFREDEGEKWDIKVDAEFFRAYPNFVYRVAIPDSGFEPNDFRAKRVIYDFSNKNQRTKVELKEDVIKSAKEAAQ